MLQRIEETLPAAGHYDPAADPVKVYTDGGCDPKGRAGPRASYGVHWPSHGPEDAWGAVPGKNPILGGRRGDGGGGRAHAGHRACSFGHR